jgi:hypothetical protein
MNSTHETTLLSPEELLIRSGDILNILGVLRAARLNNYNLQKNVYESLIKRNYNFDLDKDLPSGMKESIKEVWDEAIQIFNEFDMLKNGDNEKIILKSRHQERDKDE